MRALFAWLAGERGVIGQGDGGVAGVAQRRGGRDRLPPECSVVPCTLEAGRDTKRQSLSEARLQTTDTDRGQWPSRNV